MNNRSSNFLQTWILPLVGLVAAVYLEILMISSVHTISGYGLGKIPSVTVYFIPCILTGMVFFKILSVMYEKIYGGETKKLSADTSVKIPSKAALMMFLALIIPLFMFFFASNLHLIKSGRIFNSSLTISGAVCFVTYLLSAYYEDRFPARNGRIKRLSLILTVILTVAGWGMFFGSMM